MVFIVVYGRASGFVGAFGGGFNGFGHDAGVGTTACGHAGTSQLGVISSAGGSRSWHANSDWTWACRFMCWREDGVHLIHKQRGLRALKKIKRKKERGGEFC